MLLRFILLCLVKTTDMNVNVGIKELAKTNRVMHIMIIGKVCCLLIWKCNFFFITIINFGTLKPWMNAWKKKNNFNCCFQFIVSCIFLLESIAIYYNIILQMWKKKNILLPKNLESNNIAIVFWYALGRRCPKCLSLIAKILIRF